jgi:hypothetical protein
MTRLSEETLNAYLDGVLDVATRAEVESGLRADAEARALLEKLRTADRLAIDAFAAPMREPLPPALVEAVLSAPAPRGAEDYAPPVLAPRARGRRTRDYALPIGASLALVAGIAVGAFMGRQPPEAPGGLALGIVDSASVLNRLLEGHPSGSTLDADGVAKSPLRLGAVATFRDRHGRPCREIEALLPGEESGPESNRGGQAIAAGVACRDASARWVVEGVARLSPPALGVQFEPAGVPEKDALEGLLTMLGAQRALEATEEQALIERRWKD